MPFLTVDSGCAAPNAVDIADVDQDGLLDILFGFPRCDARFDIGPGAKILLNTGDRKFVDRTDLLQTTKKGSSSALFMTLLGSSDRVIVTATSPDCAGTGEPNEGTFRQTSRGDDGYPRFTEYVAVPPATGFRGTSVPRGESHLPFIYFGSMGFAAGDLDGDGLNDLATSLNPWHGVLQAQRDGGMVDRTLDMGFTLPSIGSRRTQLAWALAFLDLDRDGRPDVLWVHGDDYISDPEAYIGPQNVTAHWNAGNMVFQEITAPLNLGLLGQYMAMSVGDLDRDGYPDLIVGGQGSAPQVYRNAIRDSPPRPRASGALAARGFLKIAAS